MDDKKLFNPKLSFVDLFYRFELDNMKKMLIEDEQLLGVITGLYGGGVALLGITSKRLLLVDKKWLRMTYEDIRFDKVNEVKFSQHILLASLLLFHAGQQLQFKTWYIKELRLMAEYILKKMFEVTEEMSAAEEPKAKSTSDILKNTYQSADYPLSSFDNHALQRWRRATEYIARLPIIQRW